MGRLGSRRCGSSPTARAAAIGPGSRPTTGVIDAGELLGADARHRPRAARRRAGSTSLRRRRRAAARRRRSPTPSCCRRCPDPEKIVCIGLNYRSHADEAGIDPPEAPTFFAKFRNALAAARRAEVQLPAASEKVDYEAEVAFVIGRRCKEVDPDEALEAVAGYMLLNDLSARDLQFATPQWMPGQGLRRLRALRARAGHPRRGGARRRDLLRARPERRADAGRRRPPT